MPTHLAFLRAINLGAKRKFGKDAIKAAVESVGFTDVATHINTGNVRFTTTMRSPQRITEKLQTAFAADRGFEVPTIVFGLPEFRQIVADADELGHADLARHYVWLMQQEPDPEFIAGAEALSTDDQRVVVRGRACHLLLGQVTQGVVDPSRSERFLGVATNRNVTVLRAIAAKWC
ncbi:DUF1697 domain-containing protein [Propionibacteriaceae bacterium Y1685]|uniref:DUF1697 domain-containing protein n=1 Tax=Microlunatus sp. Y1700 TaxID=3418487 RepID=UPI003B7986DF